MRRINGWLIAAVLIVATLAAAAPVDMNMDKAIPLGDSSGWILLPSKADAVVVCMPEAEGTVSLWTVNGAGAWRRVRPLVERTTLRGTTLPASPDSVTTVMEDDCFWWPAAGDVRLIYYTRSAPTRVLAYWHEATNQ